MYVIVICSSTLSDRHILLLLTNKLDKQPDDPTHTIPVVGVYSVDPWQLKAKEGS